MLYNTISKCWERARKGARLIQVQGARCKSEKQVMEQILVFNEMDQRFLLGFKSRDAHLKTVFLSFINPEPPGRGNLESCLLTMHSHFLVFVLYAHTHYSG